jgi:hypothetical protein
MGDGLIRGWTNEAYMQKGGKCMIFNNAIEQALAAKDKTLTSIVKLGTVTSVSGGRAKIQHYGESTPSGKEYVFIEGYYPEVGDKVAMLPQANTFIILGKISDSEAIEYATKEYVDDTFLEKEYKNKLEDGNNVVTLSGTELIPGANNSIKLGKSGTQFLALYAKEIYQDGNQIDFSKIYVVSGGTTYSLTLSVSSGTATLTPSSDNVFVLGSSSKKFKEAYLGKFRGTWGSGNGTERNVSWNQYNALIPDNNNAVDLGSTTRQFKNIYGQTLYANGTAVSSDRRVKDDIKTLEEKHIAFFKALRPVQYKFKEGDSGRTHTGFIAQEVEEAVEEAGMTSQDMAVVVKDPSDRYYLRYEEIISVQTKVIQDLMAKVESLEARITKLEGKGENK